MRLRRYVPPREGAEAIALRPSKSIIMLRCAFP